MGQLDISIADAIIRTAVIENHEEDMKLLDEDTSPVSFSEAHEKRMRRLFANARARHAAARAWTVTRKTVTAAAIVIAVLSSILMLNTNVRAAVSEVIAEFFAEFTSFRFNSNTGKPVGDIEWELRWLPESFNESYREFDGGVSRAGYTNSDGITVRFTAAPADSRQINVDNEHSEYSIKTVDGIEYHIFDSTSEIAPSVIIWVYNAYSFSVSSYCDIDMLEKIAYSVDEADR